jgi:putative hydrolase of the HAD superfamily
MKVIETIGFDADDTLWHNENIYSLTQNKFKELLSPYHSSTWIDKRLYDTEMRNLKFYGYGIKSFTLSMIETAIELSDGKISGAEIKRILNFGREMMTTPVALFDQVADVLSKLSQEYQLMLITKGDLIDQQSKIARSGLSIYFEHLEVVSNKRSETYRMLLDRHAINPETFLMVGNSLKSDILPVKQIGGTAVYIPYTITWAHEKAEDDEMEKHDYYHLQHIKELPELMRSIRNGVL